MYNDDSIRMHLGTAWGGVVVVRDAMPEIDTIPCEVLTFCRGVLIVKCVILCIEG